ncbi:WD40 repeat domain-containing protein [Acrocarpospora sp. B8E8]|uniref:WD40 repeat domain-containing protein n=1 Tax=Acrocarpospora sp. B8E8 TaxID=3153572 RepID=UPI00325F6826
MPRLRVATPPPRPAAAISHHQRRQDGTTVKPGHRTTDRQTLTGHTRPVSGVAFHLEGQLLATSSYDATVRFWLLG